MRTRTPFAMRLQRSQFSAVPSRVTDCDVKADLDAGAVGRRIGGRKIAQDAAPDLRPSACTRIVSVTARSPLRSTVTSLMKCRMRSSAARRRKRGAAGQNGGECNAHARS